MITFDTDLDNRNLTSGLSRDILNMEVMELNRSAVTELLAFYATSGKARRVAVEGRDFYSLSYRYYGKVLLKTREAEIISGASSITFMPKNTSYETEIMEDTKMAVVHFRLDKDIGLFEPSVLNVQSGEVLALFEKLIDGFRVDAPVDFGCMAIFYELLARLEALAPLGEEYVPKKIALARERMIRDFSDSFFSISALAEALAISTAYLRREFSRAYGKSPSRFLRDLRVENSKNLLQSEYLSIGQIGELCGFSSESYFIQVFHKATGQSPQRYRQQLYRNKR